MSSTRPKLKLDEQSFQGLLAAAFTIQEHKDHGGLSSAHDALEDLVRKRSGVTTPCKQCGAPLLSDTDACVTCGAEKLRPGERLQRTWASMWLKSQEQGGWQPRESTGDDPYVPKANGNGHSGAVNPPSSGLRAVNPKRFIETSEDAPMTRSADDASFGVHLPPPPSAPDSLQVEIQWPEPAASAAPTDRFVEPQLRTFRDEAPASAAEDVAEGTDDEFASSAALAVPDEYGDLVADSRNYEQPLGEQGFADTSPENSLSTAPSQHSLWDLRVRLRFQRADLYLGLAVFVAAAALLWPTGTPRQASLPFWERTLIALGVADAPQQVVRYHGDPNLKVWVDTHTALYYCPGDELYGKSAGGHFTTQHEAQADRFEPAQASACIQ